MVSRLELVDLAPHVRPKRTWAGSVLETLGQSNILSVQSIPFYPLVAEIRKTPSWRLFDAFIIFAANVSQRRS
jgi:hypothetical protein